VSDANAYYLENDEVTLIMESVVISNESLPHCGTWKRSMARNAAIEYSGGYGRKAAEKREENMRGAPKMF
jgi:hypothetical protein